MTTKWTAVQSNVLSISTLSFFASDFGIERIAGNSDHRNSKQINHQCQKQWKQINIKIIYINTRHACDKDSLKQSKQSHLFYVLSFIITM